MLIGLANTPYLVRPYIKFSIHFCPDLGHKEIAKSYTIHSTKLTHTHMRPAALWHPNRRSKNVLYGDERSTFLKMLCSTILPRALCPIAPILLHSQKNWAGRLSQADRKRLPNYSSSRKRINFLLCLIKRQKSNDLVLMDLYEKTFQVKKCCCCYLPYMKQQTPLRCVFKKKSLKLLLLLLGVCSFFSALFSEKIALASSTRFLA